MAKKSFGTQLFQGFIKSAVNQVGRDGGKVVSNRVYGNAHSTPIRGVTQKVKGNYVEVEGKGFLEELQNWHHKPNPILYVIGKFVGNFFLLTPYYLYLAITYRSKNKEVIYSQEPHYVSDRRYSSGTRIEGYQRVRTKYYRELGEDEKNALLYRSNLIFLSVGLFLIYACYLWLS